MECMHILYCTCMSASRSLVPSFSVFVFICLFTRSKTKFGFLFFLFSFLPVYFFFLSFEAKELLSRLDLDWKELDG